MNELCKEDSVLQGSHRLSHDRPEIQSRSSETLAPSVQRKRACELAGFLRKEYSFFSHPCKGAAPGSLHCATLLAEQPYSCQEHLLVAKMVIAISILLFCLLPFLFSAFSHKLESAISWAPSIRRHEQKYGKAVRRRLYRLLLNVPFLGAFPTCLGLFQY